MSMGISEQAAVQLWETQRKKDQLERMLLVVTQGMVTKQGEEFNDVSAGQCVAIANMVCEFFEEEEARKRGESTRPIHG